MAERALTVDEIMAILPETPRRLSGLTTGLTAKQLRAAPTPGAWSANDVLAHLRACQDVLGGSMLRIVREDMPKWRAMSPRTWMRRTDYPDWAYAPALAAFERQRAERLATLEPLPASAWDRTAKVTGRQGGTDDKTVIYYGDWLAGHERIHWRQIEQIVAALTCDADLGALPVRR